MALYDFSKHNATIGRLTDRVQFGQDGTTTSLPDADAYLDKDGKIRTSPLYDENGLPIPQKDVATVMGHDGFLVDVEKPAKVSDDALDQYKMVERYGAGFISTKGTATVKPTTPRPTKFMFPRHASGQDMLEIVYTEECREILELIQDKMEEMAKQNLKPATVLMGKHQYRQYIAVRSYQEGTPMLPDTIIEANIVIMDQEHYFDIVPSTTNMIVHKL